VTGVTDDCSGAEQTSGMKHNKPISIAHGTDAESVISLLTFCAVVGILFWIIRIGCDAAFRAIVAR